MHGFLTDFFSIVKFEVHIRKTQLDDLAKIDHIILRAITGSQAKSPNEFLYLKTDLLANVEITKRVYNEIKMSPLPGDWINLMKKLD